MLSEYVTRNVFVTRGVIWNPIEIEHHHRHHHHMSWDVFCSIYFASCMDRPLPLPFCVWKKEYMIEESILESLYL